MERASITGWIVMQMTVEHMPNSLRTPENDGLTTMFAAYESFVGAGRW